MDNIKKIKDDTNVENEKHVEKDDFPRDKSSRGESNEQRQSTNNNKKKNDSKKRFDGDDIGEQQHKRIGKSNHKKEKHHNPKKNQMKNKAKFEKLVEMDENSGKSSFETNDDIDPENSRNLNNTKSGKKTNSKRNVLEEETCGLDTPRRIIGGTTTDIDEFPWLCLLQYTDRKLTKKIFLSLSLKIIILVPVTLQFINKKKNICDNVDQ